VAADTWARLARAQVLPPEAEAPRSRKALALHLPAQAIEGGQALVGLFYFFGPVGDLRILLRELRVHEGRHPRGPRPALVEAGLCPADASAWAQRLGNPHCAVFLEEVADDALVDKLGPALERHAAFPSRTNVEFITVVSRGEIRVRLWERGVGPTRSSGTGSASAAVAAILKGLVDRRLRVVCDGGVLEVEWPEGGEVRQVGEAEILFEGDWLG